MLITSEELWMRAWKRSAVWRSIASRWRSTRAMASEAWLASDRIATSTSRGSGSSDSVTIKARGLPDTATQVSSDEPPSLSDRAGGAEPADEAAAEPAAEDRAGPANPPSPATALGRDAVESLSVAGRAL